MADRFRYAQVRQMIIDAMKVDLMGPQSEDEVLDENPRHAYIIGLLAPQSEAGADTAAENEQELEADIDHEDDNNFTAGEDDDNEPVVTTRFKLPSSIGISFYVAAGTESVCLDVSWGDYAKTSDKYTDKEGKERSRVAYARQPMKETLTLSVQEIGRSTEYRLTSDSNVSVYISRIPLKNGYSFLTAYVMNRRKNPENDVEGLMFQVEIRAYSPDGRDIFVAEFICRKVPGTEEVYFSQRPIIGRGRGCAATWGPVRNGFTSWVKSDFIPQYEFPGVSAELENFGSSFFSMRFLSRNANKEEITERLNVLADTYERWIGDTLSDDSRMQDDGFRTNVGNDVIDKCRKALARIRAGIALISSDETAWDAFCFMNRVMLLQRNIASYAKKHGADIECNFGDFVDPKKSENDFGWRPFQIAFILMNLNGIVHPEHEDREVVDLLYFPTGGGKTEAYLGLMAFVIANRRLRASETGAYNLDGGVTAILRYTLRLLTTQQRDRITKMVIAAEMVRQKTAPRYGNEPISIGFWVGGGVTPNSFEELKESAENPGEAASKRRLIYRQLLSCPFCGKKLNEENFEIDTERHAVSIYCSDRFCQFYRYRQNRQKIPVYLVDEEIYARCPTIILSTVDKFARLPWDVSTNTLFGRVDRYCDRTGYVAIGEKNPPHSKTRDLPAATITAIRPFLPPELIIQDELHLITGPLGTIYGAYETIIEDMCTYGEPKIRPKYVVSTATIKNAPAQTRCLYARRKTAQFPPNGFDIGDSFFIKEIPVTDNPFRRYVGVCGNGQSVRTTLLRIYAVLLQKVYDLAQREEFRDVIDPYYTLIGYHNSIRELGGTVRLLQDDIPKRIVRIQKKYHMSKRRYANHRIEITSRMSSFEIPNKLRQLETDSSSRDCLDTAVATNMIAVGMDVDRLGLMVVDGQPKQNSEYIQATSRIGRSFPGLVVMIYNPYRPRDLSHYENFTGYHSQLYRFVEGTTATPFSARARDRVLHALVIAAIRLKYSDMAQNDAAANIGALTDEQMQEVESLILDRLGIIKPSIRQDAEAEIEQFIDSWKRLAAESRPLKYKGPLFRKKDQKYNALMGYYGGDCADTEKPTLTSMRDVEGAANMFYYEGD